MSEAHANGRRQGNRRNNYRDNRNDRNGNRNGGGRRKPVTFTNKINNLLTLRLPQEGGKITQYRSFFGSLLTYASTDIGKNTTKIWVKEYLQSNDSGWEPKPPQKPKEAEFTDAA